MNITILTQSTSRLAGGLFNSVRNLSLFLNNQNNMTLEIYSQIDKYSEPDKCYWDELNLFLYRTYLFKNFGFNPFIKKRIIRNTDILHQHGIWNFQSTIKHKHKIISPRGMLDSWALNNSKFKKEIVAYLFEKKNLEKSSCIHALCTSEYKSIRNYGLKNPVAIIPNGINIPIIQKELTPPWKKKINKKVILFIGRLHPKKGLENLIEAIHMINNTNLETLKNWELKIAGWDQLNHEVKLRELCLKYNLSDFIEFLGPVYDESKQSALQNADAFILPSYSEGLPMSILEAWSYKLPVLMTDFCNIPEGFTNNAALRIDNEPKLMALQLSNFFKLKDVEIKKIGLNGFNLVKQKYTWDQISDQMIQLYQWILEGGEKPAFVYL